MTLARSVCVGWMVVFAVGCAGDTDPIEPDPDPPARPTPAALALEGGVTFTDTISTIYPDFLVARVTTAAAAPIRDLTVRFAGLGPVQVDAAGSWGTSGTATTDATGRARIRFRFGTVAGAGGIVVTVADTAGRPLLADTASYTILPGRRVAVRLLPRDTILAPGSSLEIRGPVLDREGNPHPDPATFTVRSPSVVTMDGRTVRATGSGVTWLVTTATLDGRSVTDSARVSVVPTDLLAWQLDVGGRVMVGDMYGRVTRSFDGDEPSWSPDRSRIAFSRARDNLLYLADANGTVTPLATGSVVGISEPENSADGAWIYFSGSASNERSRIYRVHPDGTGLEAVTENEVVRGAQVRARMPSTSPDGRSLVFNIYVEGFNPSYGLRMRDPDGTMRTLTEEPIRDPVWSPTGAWIAGIRDGTGDLTLIRPNGSGLRTVPGVTMRYAMSWSRDGEWIAGFLFQESGFALVHVSSGAVLKFPGRTGGRVAWWR